MERKRRGQDPRWGRRIEGLAIELGRAETGLDINFIRRQIRRRDRHNARRLLSLEV